MRDHIFADDHNNNDYRWGLYNELVEEAMWRSTQTSRRDPNSTTNVSKFAK